METKHELKNANKKYFKIKTKRNIRNDIINLLKKSELGLNISQVSENLNLSRNTVKNYLARLEHEGIISVKEIGRSKISILYSKTKSGENYKFPSYLSRFSKSFFDAFQKVSKSYPIDTYLCLKQLGSEMGKTIDPDYGKLIDSFNLNKKEQISLTQLAKITLQFFNFINTFGNLAKAEIVPSDNHNKKSSLILKITIIPPELGKSEVFYQISAGFFESKLRENFGENIYLDIFEFQKENSCCYYILRIGDK